jgi:chemotaxis regulatin CheY-phosphate phosphatase CheZ
MNKAESQPWYRLYASAVVELDRQRLIERVEATEAAIHGRLRDLQYDSDHHEERQLIADAQDTLALLRRRP